MRRHLITICAFYATVHHEKVFVILFALLMGSNYIYIFCDYKGASQNFLLFQNLILEHQRGKCTEGKKRLILAATSTEKT